MTVVAVFVLTLGGSVAAKAQVLVSNGDVGNVLEFGYNGAVIGSPFVTTPSAAGLAFDLSGRFFVANYNPRTLTRFNADGSGGTVVLASAGNVDGITLGPDGMLYINVNDPLNGKVLRFDPTTNAVATLVSGLQSTISTAFDSAGRLYVQNYNAGTILRFLPDGTPDGVFASGLNGPAGLALDAAGDLYVTTYIGRQLLRFLPNGTLDTVVATGLHYPHGIGFGPDGNLYLTETGDDGTLHDVLRYKSDGSFDDVFVASSTAGLTRPLFVAFRPALGVPEPGPLAMLVGFVFALTFALYRLRPKNRHRHSR